MDEILQKVIPYPAQHDADLPGIGPLDSNGWIVQDDAFAGQMRKRDQLLNNSSHLVHADAGASSDAKSEVLEQVLEILRKRAGYLVTQYRVTRPDGITIPLQGDPLWIAAQLIQEDLCLHEKRGDEHVLTSAVMCFPASWTLAEKIGRPLSAIRDPRHRD